MVSVLQESAPSYTMVKNGLAYGQQGREAEDDPRPGRPGDGSDGGKCSKIEKFVLADRRIKLWQIAEELQISKERVGEIIRAYEYEKNQCALGTKMLTPFDKQRRLQTSTRQSYRSDVGSYRAECCFTRQCICPHGAGFEAGPEGHGLSEIDHPPYSPDLAPSDYFLFQFKKGVT
ncbi:hypothetical protein EVAR_63073_1 [Eumeta japonica]|uniref:Histone-lysine N-methyltransferase SETMAR n=1 Tax=Eumeta variegata TaxID=151549 RepID=A0A4C1Z6A4_EUMVA|nr:hypothetical protein EVAR_63073_1 [Eumeta japonica]